MRMHAHSCCVAAATPHQTPHTLPAHTAARLAGAHACICRVANSGVSGARSPLARMRGTRVGCARAIRHSCWVAPAGAAGRLCDMCSPDRCASLHSRAWGFNRMSAPLSAQSDACLLLQLARGQNTPLPQLGAARGTRPSPARAGRSAGAVAVDCMVVRPWSAHKQPTRHQGPSARVNGASGSLVADGHTRGVPGRSRRACARGGCATQRLLRSWCNCPDSRCQLPVTLSCVPRCCFGGFNSAL